jgi:hypothetical protein
MLRAAEMTNSTASRMEEAHPKQKGIQPLPFEHPTISVLDVIIVDSFARRAVGHAPDGYGAGRISQDSPKTTFSASFPRRKKTSR